MLRGILTTTFALVLGTVAALADGSAGLKPLVTGEDSQGWSGVGRLNIGSDSFCTGSLIAQDLVLTAAHCLYEIETGQRIRDAEIEFLADWRGGRASAIRQVKRSLVHPDFVLEKATFVERVAVDVALLQLEEPIRLSSVAPFRVQGRPATGAAVDVVSYGIDRADSPALQEACHVMARQSGSLVLTCSVDFGSSGAPIFVIEDGQPRIVSVVSAKAKVSGRPVALGTALEAPLAQLMAMHDSGAHDTASARPPVRRLLLDAASSSSGAKFLRP